jgi:hypothetical protein
MAPIGFGACEICGVEDEMVTHAVIMYLQSRTLRDVMSQRWELLDVEQLQSVDPTTLPSNL